MKRPLTEMDTRETITCIALEGAVSTVEWGSRRSSFCGTEADEDGNISFEHEAANLDAQSLALAARNSGGTANWYAGTVWLRVVFGPTHAHCYYGIGAGSTPPTSWTRIDSFPLGSSSPNFSEALGLGLTDLVVFTTRAGGLAADECTAQDIRWRSLLGAPT